MVASGPAVKQRHHLARDDLVQIKHGDARRLSIANPHGIHARYAKERLAHHEVDIDLKRALTAECGGMPRDPLAAGVLLWLAAHLIPLRGQKTI